MAGDHRNRGPLPPNHEQSDSSQYPPIPGEERSHMASGPVTLPSIRDPHRPYGSAAGRPWDPRANTYRTSPISSNAYPPPPIGASTTPGGGGAYASPGSSHQPYLPPVQANAQDAYVRTAAIYAGQQAPPYGAPAYEYSYRPDRGPPGPYPQGYPQPPPGAGPSMQQSAPRQRTSIACKYCRRRKIRCSGYQNSQGGKCTNCIKMNQECLFQPVSSTAGTAFVPVSALTNGVPPGVQLYGAYGQPLQGGGAYQPPNSQYEQPLPSPTGSYASFTDERPEPGRRRPRDSDEHGVRLPPPSTFPPDENTPRRSPSSNSPSHLQPYQYSQQQTMPHHAYDNRTPPPRGSPSGTPARGSSAGSVMSMENNMGTSSSVMSLENIMGSAPSSGSSIDHNMLNRLNRRTQR